MAGTIIGANGILLSNWTTATRPTSPVLGQMGYNSTLYNVETWNGSGWTLGGGSATGGGTDTVFVTNSQTITTSYTIPIGKSASSTGPITINSGATITIPSGSRWVIL